MEPPELRSNGPRSDQGTFQGTSRAHHQTLVGTLPTYHYNTLPTYHYNTAGREAQAIGRQPPLPLVREDLHLCSRMPARRVKGRRKQKVARPWLHLPDDVWLNILEHYAVRTRPKAWQLKMLMRVARVNKTAAELCSSHTDNATWIRSHARDPAFRASVFNTTSAEEMSALKNAGPLRTAITTAPSDDADAMKACYLKLMQPILDRYASDEIDEAELRRLKLAAQATAAQQRANAAAKARYLRLAMSALDRYEASEIDEAELRRLVRAAQATIPTDQQ